MEEECNGAGIEKVIALRSFIDGRTNTAFPEEQTKRYNFRF